MVIGYSIIVGIVAYICGAITKCFIEQMPNKYIPIQNVAIGIISGLICYFCKIEANLVQSFALCLLATMGAGGIADLIKLIKKGE